MLDVRTLLAALGTGFLLMAFMGVYLSCLHREEKAIRYWAAGCLTIAVSDALLFFRPVLPDMLTIVGGNATTIAGGYLLYAGISAFDGLPKRLALGAALTAGGAALIAYWTYVDPNIRMRITTSTSIIALIMTLMAAHLLRPGIREHNLLRRILGVLFSALVLLSLVRIADVVMQPASSDLGIFSNSPLAAAWLMGLLAVTFLSSLDFLLMPGQRMQRQLNELVRLDELTGLLNRRAFNRDMQARPDGERPACVMLLDLDRFKHLNDLHGHAAGDAVLQGFAAMVTAQLRGGDVFARYGGEEFSILLPRTGADSAALVAERIRAAVERMEVRSGDALVGATVSIGIAEVGADGFEAAIIRADKALYRAKSLGRNRVELGEPA
jgi:diguanylate cyclase (GGDEF)-like protein